MFSGKQEGVPVLLGKAGRRLGKKAGKKIAGKKIEIRVDKYI